MTRLASVILMLALLAGCASTPQQFVEAREVAELLAHYDRVAGVPLEDQRREYMAAQLAFDRSPKERNRLDLALMLLLPRAPWRDDKRIQALLDGAEKGSAEQASARRGLGQLLLTLLAERQRKVEQQALQLRDERRRTDDMRQKVDSLMAIDRDMSAKRRLP